MLGQRQKLLLRPYIEIYSRVAPKEDVINPSPLTKLRNPSCNGSYLKFKN